MTFLFLSDFIYRYIAWNWLQNNPWMFGFIELHRFWWHQYRDVTNIPVAVRILWWCINLYMKVLYGWSIGRVSNENNRLADHTSVQFFRFETIHSLLYLNYVGFESLAIAIIEIIGLRLKLYLQYKLYSIIYSVPVTRIQLGSTLMMTKDKFKQKGG